MSFGITVERAIQDAQVVFTASLETAAEALATATLFATGNAPAATAKIQPAATEKKAQTADASAKASQDKPIRTASDNSGSSSSESTNAAATDSKADAPALDYTKDIKPLVLDIAKISRAKAEGLLQRFGVASAKDLKADQFAEFKAKAEQVIAGTYDPVASDEEAIA
ncbi:hypothetical protein A7J71_11245 [Achromobacter insolitus]|uniref:hypothetical protein n=1 Tax=Achromobacter insolitus TaxID=217204 RepID=UPI0007C6A13C|nr:hypothetical protein [Achromobacter insolitus]OAE72587.1 hypothetical protein A7J71_11245 [Achromobacter insolitus]